MRYLKVFTMMMSLGLLLAGLVPFAAADEASEQAQVTFTQPVQIPGIVLPAGKYIFRRVDPNGNLSIFEVINARNDKGYGMIEATPAYRAQTTNMAEFILKKSDVKGAPEMLHEYFYPGLHEGWEFFYYGTQK